MLSDAPRWTKADLLRFLEPFSDDILIVYEDGEYGACNLSPSYKIAIAEGKFEDTYPRALGLHEGEGYVVV